MRGKWLWIPLAVTFAALLPFALTALAEEEGETEWTVMFYMCGSDLESKYHYATDNLEEIARCTYPSSSVKNVLDAYQEFSGVVGIPRRERVNVLVETGGCKEWHCQKLGMDISNKALQRWKFETTD